MFCCEFCEIFKNTSGGLLLLPLFAATVFWSIFILAKYLMKTPRSFFFKKCIHALDGYLFKNNKTLEQCQGVMFQRCYLNNFLFSIRHIANNCSQI